MRAHPFISVISLASSLVLWQAPEFMQQYLQRLAGAVDELERVVQHFDDDSRSSGYERSAALRVMANNPERLIRDQATRMEGNIARLNRLREQQEAMRDGGSFVRFATFVMNFDRPLVERTFDSYALALPMTVEGASFAVVGFFVPYFLMAAMATALRRRGSWEAA